MKSNLMAIIQSIRTWKEICESLPPRNFPYKFETDERGNVLMSPMFARHGFFQAEISNLLKKYTTKGVVVTECAIQTTSGTKVADVSWFTKERWILVREDYDVHISPEIAVEILSLSNTVQEMESKKDLYFQAGSIEFWICDLKGNLYFYNKQSKLLSSELVPDFPSKIEEG